eukprot:TRINITY_DN74722_c0_g1_i1.p1 TRINITY_DN74722_c0_g1~~TRINITY_DN74722_c0_g1_i1.p1  ORF type:complete len:1037 (-),score=133.79 TRINITY_DN74722_c0_g1_i1:484-3594(-)
MPAPVEGHAKTPTRRHVPAPAVVRYSGGGETEPAALLSRAMSAEELRRRRPSGELLVSASVPAAQAKIRSAGFSTNGPVLGDMHSGGTNRVLPTRGRLSSQKGLEKQRRVSSAEPVVSVSAMGVIPERPAPGVTVEGATDEAFPDTEPERDESTRAFEAAEAAVAIWSSTWTSLLDQATSLTRECSREKEDVRSLLQSKEGDETGGFPTPRNSPVLSGRSCQNDDDASANCNASDHNDVTKLGDCDVQDRSSAAVSPSHSSGASRLVGGGTVTCKKPLGSLSTQGPLSRGGSGTGGVGGCVGTTTTSSSCSSMGSRRTAVGDQAGRRAQARHVVAVASSLKVPAEAQVSSPPHQTGAVVGASVAGKKAGQSQGQIRNLVSQLRNREEEITKLRQQLFERTLECSQLRKQTVGGRGSSGAVGRRGGRAGCGGCRGGAAGVGGECAGGSGVVSGTAARRGDTSQDSEKMHTLRAQEAAIARRMRTPSPSLPGDVISVMTASSSVKALPSRRHVVSGVGHRSPLQRSPSGRSLNNRGRDSESAAAMSAVAGGGGGDARGRSCSGPPSDDRNNDTFVPRGPDWQSATSGTGICAEASAPAVDEHGEVMSGSTQHVDRSAKQPCDLSDEILSTGKESSSSFKGTPTVAKSDTDANQQTIQSPVSFSQSGEQMRAVSAVQEQRPSCEPTSQDHDVEVLRSALSLSARTIHRGHSTGALLQSSHSPTRHTEFNAAETNTDGSLARTESSGRTQAPSIGVCHPVRRPSLPRSPTVSQPMLTNPRGIDSSPKISLHSRQVSQISGREPVQSATSLTTTSSVQAVHSAMNTFTPAGAAVALSSLMTAPLEGGAALQPPLMRSPRLASAALTSSQPPPRCCVASAPGFACGGERPSSFSPPSLQVCSSGSVTPVQPVAVSSPVSALRTASPSVAVADASACGFAPQAQSNMRLRQAPVPVATLVHTSPTGSLSKQVIPSPFSPQVASGSVTRHTVHSGHGVWSSAKLKDGGTPRRILASPGRDTIGQVAQQSLAGTPIGLRQVRGLP